MRRIVAGCILLISGNTFQKEMGIDALIIVLAMFVSFFFIANIKAKSLLK